MIRDNRSPEVNPVLFEIRETVAREWHYCACVFSLFIKRRRATFRRRARKNGGVLAARHEITRVCEAADHGANEHPGSSRTSNEADSVSDRLVSSEDVLGISV